MLIALDESGTDMDGVLNGAAPPADNPLYWVAGGGYFAYLWSQVRSGDRQTQGGVALC